MVKIFDFHEKIGTFHFFMTHTPVFSVLPVRTVLPYTSIAEKVP